MNEIADSMELKSSPSRFVNREFSWLQFNRRVLMEADNRKHPLLERLRFLSISADNLNEFLMVRIAGLAGQVREQVSALSDNGQTPIEQLSNATLEIAKLQKHQLETFKTLESELHDKGILLLNQEALSESERAWAEDYFLSNIFPHAHPIMH